MSPTTRGDGASFHERRDVGSEAWALALRSKAMWEEALGSFPSSCLNKDTVSWQVGSTMATSQGWPRFQDSRAGGGPVSLWPCLTHRSSAGDRQHADREQRQRNRISAAAV